jgi:beta-phosphoglucomutase
MIQAIIFDFNGVLADDDPIHMNAFRRVAAEEGLAFTDEEYLETYLPLNDWDCLKTLFEKHSKALSPARMDDLIERKSVYYFQAIAEKPVLFEGAAQAVLAAASRYPVAIASGARGREIRHILRQAGLERHFTAIVAAEDVRYGKPHPEPFLRAYERLRDSNGSLAAAACLAVEDSLGGMRSAHEAGMRCLGIAHSYDRERLRTGRPRWIIDSIADFVSWLNKEFPGER